MNPIKPPFKPPSLDCSIEDSYTAFSKEEPIESKWKEQFWSDADDLHTLHLLSSNHAKDYLRQAMTDGPKFKSIQVTMRGASPHSIPLEMVQALQEMTKKGFTVHLNLGKLFEKVQEKMVQNQRSKENIQEILTKLQALEPQTLVQVCKLAATHILAFSSQATLGKVQAHFATVGSKMVVPSEEKHFFSRRKMIQLFDEGGKKIKTPHHRWPQVYRKIKRTVLSFLRPKWFNPTSWLLDKTYNLRHGRKNLENPSEGCFTNARRWRSARDFLRNFTERKSQISKLSSIGGSTELQLDVKDEDTLPETCETESKDCTNGYLLVNKAYDLV